MLVKIIAMGLNPAIWKNVFHHLRSQLPTHPFVAGIFSTAEEIDYLTREFYPYQWRREAPDVFMCEVPAGQDWKRRLDFVRQVQAEPGGGPQALVLALRTVEHGLKQLVQGPAPVQLHLDNRTHLSLSDPAFLIRAFPADFPRLRLNEHLSALVLRRPGKKAVEVRPEALHPGSLVGFAEVEAVRVADDLLEPDEWLKRVQKASKVKLPRRGSPGMIREARGLFLFPGVPLARIASVSLDGVTFPYLMDLGQMTGEAAPFRAVRQAIRKMSGRHRAALAEHTARLRSAEDKTDLPVVCGGGPPLLRESLAGLLAARGFQRCTTLEAPGEGVFREPALLLRLGPWKKEDWGAQVEEPLVLALEDELPPLLRPLEGLVDWAKLAFHPLDGHGPRLTLRDLDEQVAELAARDAKARDGEDIADKRGLLLRQELAVLESAQAKLAELLEAKDTVQVWTGTLPASARQVLVFSHDQEEAGAVLQALPGIGKKRWFDLSSYTDADTLRTLSLEPVRHYLDGGVMVITAASRERLKALQSTIAETLAAQRDALAESEAARRFYGEEKARIGQAKEALARRWAWDALDAWMDDHMERIEERTAVLRRRHERRWFSRALVNRVAIVPSSGENRSALLGACAKLFPRLNKEHSRAVHYDYEAADLLPEEQAQAVVRAAREGGLPAEALQARLGEALHRWNAEQFATYLQVITAELEDMRPDLLVIEHRLEIAGAILTHVRRTLPALARTPAILILPEHWAPGEREPMPWPHSRVVLLRRMGALALEDCSRELSALYAV